MNNARRAEIRRALTMLAEAREIISACAEEEREAYDNLSEGFQQSERGERMNEIADSLENVTGSIEEAETELEEAIG